MNTALAPVPAAPPEKEIFYLTAHGIGNASKGYVAKWQVAGALDIPPERVVEMLYEDLMEASPITVIAKTASQAAATAYASSLPSAFVNIGVDYLADIFVFFLCPEARQSIEARIKLHLDGLLPKAKFVRLLGHSMGSIVFYCSAKRIRTTLNTASW